MYMYAVYVKHKLTASIYRHMPSHLDILVGDYRRAIDANAAACLADEKYVAEHGARSFYSFYMMHNYHSLIYAAMFAGQFRVALETVNRMEASLPVSLLSIESPPMADWLENFASVRVHVLVSNTPGRTRCETSTDFVHQFLGPLWPMGRPHRTRNAIR